MKRWHWYQVHARVEEWRVGELRVSVQLWRGRKLAPNGSNKTFTEGPAREEWRVAIDGRALPADILSGKIDRALRAALDRADALNADPRDESGP